MLFFSELISALLQLILFSIVPFIVWMITARKGNFFQWLGFIMPVKSTSFHRSILLMILGTLIYGGLTAFLAGIFSENITNAGSQFAGSGFSAIPAVLIYAYIQTGLSEELLFRGFLLKRISSKWGFNMGNILQAIVFGALHGIPFGIASHSIVLAVIFTLLPGAFAWFEGWLNEKHFGGSIVICWFLHGTVNFIAACLQL